MAQVKNALKWYFENSINVFTGVLVIAFFYSFLGYLVDGIGVSAAFCKVSKEFGFFEKTGFSLNCDKKNENSTQPTGTKQAEPASSSNPTSTVSQNNSAGSISFSGKDYKFFIQYKDGSDDAKVRAKEIYNILVPGNTVRLNGYENFQIAAPDVRKTSNNLPMEPAIIVYYTDKVESAQDDIAAATVVAGLINKSYEKSRISVYTMKVSLYTPHYMTIWMPN